MLVNTVRFRNPTQLKRTSLNVILANEKKHTIYNQHPRANTFLCLHTFNVFILLVQSYFDFKAANNQFIRPINTRMD